MLTPNAQRRMFQHCRGKICNISEVRDRNCDGVLVRCDARSGHRRHRRDYDSATLPSYISLSPSSVPPLSGFAIAATPRVVAGCPGRPMGSFSSIRCNPSPLSRAPAPPPARPCARRPQEGAQVAQRTHEVHAFSVHEGAVWAHEDFICQSTARH